jgi:hypothetical protein
VTFQVFRKDMKTYHFSIEFFLQEIQKQPEIFLTMARKEPEVIELEGIEPILVSTFYEDFVIDTDYDYKLIKLIEGLMEIKIKNIIAPSDLFKEKCFLSRILTSYFRRPEYKHFLRMLYSPFAVKEFIDPNLNKKQSNSEF